MKVRITQEAKKWLTLAQAPVARQIVMDMKESEESAADVLMSAANGYRRSFDDRGKRCELGWPTRVLEAKAEICGNQRVYNYFSEGSGTLDVWVSGYVLFSKGILEIHSCLSDIWSLGPDGAAQNLVNHSYIQAFVGKK